MSYLNPNQSWWQASFCFSNIVLAIGSTVLVTFASILQSAKDQCFNDESICQANPSDASCTIQTHLTLTKNLLFIYSLGFGFHSLFWIVYLCCQGQERHAKMEERQVDRSMLQLTMNALGCFLTATSLISLSIYTAHVQLLLPSISFKLDNAVNLYDSSEATQIESISVCSEFFSSMSWNIVSIITLITALCFHGCIVGYIIVVTKYFKKEHQQANVPSINVAFAPDFNQQQTRHRIPSSRTYPSSPISFKPLTISPSMSIENKFSF